jgi:hypothetical protein
MLHRNLLSSISSEKPTSCEVWITEKANKRSGAETYSCCGRKAEVAYDMDVQKIRGRLGKMIAEIEAHGTYLQSFQTCRCHTKELVFSSPRPKEHCILRRLQLYSDRIEKYKILCTTFRYLKSN